MKPNFKYYNDPNYNPDVFFGDNEHTVRAFHPDTGEQMGKLSFYGKDAITPGEIDKIEVTEKFRRQGVATGLLEEARRLSAVDENVPYVVHSKSRTSDGDAWAKSTGDYLPEKNTPTPALTPAPTSTADDLIEPDIVKAIENPTAEEYATARARGDLIATEAYDHGAEVAKSTASGDVLSEPPPPKPTRTGPGEIGKPADVRTRPSSRGADAASTTTGSTPKPPPTTGSVAMDTPKVPTTPPSSGAPSKMRGLMDDGLEAAKNVATRNPMGIRAAAVAGLLGVGAVVAGRRGQPRSDQRNTYLEESRRKMQG
jgi:hypothetical protein